MIAIIGSRRDDLLYLTSYAEEVGEPIALPCGQTYQIGKIDGVEVIFGVCGVSNYLSAIYCSELFTLFPLPTVIKIGDVVSFDSSLLPGDIVISNLVYPHGVNFHGDGYRYGEIPGGIPSAIACSRIGNKLEGLDIPFKTFDILSGEKAIYERGEFEAILKRRFLSQEGMGAYDVSSYGIALSCYLHQSSFIDIGVVTLGLGEDEEGKLKMRKRALSKQTDIGRIVVRLIEGGAQ